MLLESIITLVSISCNRFKNTGLAQKRTLNTFTVFAISVKHWQYETYEVSIFVELADNWFSSCIVVVGVNSRKWGHFGGRLCAAQCALVDRWGWFLNISESAV